MVFGPLPGLIGSLWLSLRVLRGKLGRLWFVWAIWALWGVLIYFAADYENVLWLPNYGPDRGRGLLEHYSFWASFFVGPALVTIAYLARSHSLKFALDAVERHATDTGREKIKKEVRTLAERSQRTLLSYLPLIPLGAFGIYFSARTFDRLGEPVVYWGNDVFNALTYPMSSFFANGYLFTLWSVAYPLATVYMIQTAISVQMVVVEAMRHNALDLDLLHPDGCAGLARFGNLNLGLMSLYILPAVPIGVLYVTHEKQYFTVAQVALPFLIIVVLQSSFGLWSIHRLIRSTRDSAIESWNEKVRSLVTRQRLGSTEALVALRYRECLVAVRSFPYEKSALFAIQVLQLVLGFLVILDVTESNSERFSTNSVETPRG